MHSSPRIKEVGPGVNFLGLARKHSSFARSEIVVLPTPYEHTVSYGEGTRRGPAAILKASHYVEFYDEELERELCHDVGIATLPAFSFGGTVHARAMDKLRMMVQNLLGLGKFVATLGGEHTISQATIRAHLDRYPDLSVLQVDAHSDLRDSYQGSRYSHASVMARVCEFMDPRRIIQIGIRAQSREEALFITQKGINTFYAHQIHGGGRDTWQAAVLSRLSDHVYITFDVDGLDPSIMPSTGTPEPDGLLWTETMSFLRKVGEERSLVGFDVVELAPLSRLSHADLTAAKLTYKLMNYAFLSHAR